MKEPPAEKPYITCRELIGFILDYLEGELDPGQRHEFERHLAVCPSCVAYLKSYQETIKIGKAVFAHPDEPPSDDVPEELVQAILAARRKK